MYCSILPHGTLVHTYFHQTRIHATFNNASTDPERRQINLYEARKIAGDHSNSKPVIPSEVVVVGTHPRTSKNYRKS